MTKNKMYTIRIIRSKPEEIRARMNNLENRGYAVIAGPIKGPQDLRAIGENPPDAVVIDLSRAPSTGRDIALTLRKTQNTRHIPLIFVDGTKEKTTPIRDILPDAIFTSWEKCEELVVRTIQNPVQNPVVPESVFAPYKNTPLSRKLGIKPDMLVSAINSPAHIDEMLKPLPDGAVVVKSVLPEAKLVLYFVKSIDELKQNLNDMVKLTRHARLWIMWPKKSGKVSDLSQNTVRQIGLAAGLVDYKICSVDVTWSGLLFTRKVS